MLENQQQTDTEPLNISFDWMAEGASRFRNLYDWVSDQTVQDCIQELATNQSKNNLYKAQQKANRKTTHQVMKYLEQIFKHGQEKANTHRAAIMMLYIEKLGDKATLLGLKRYIQKNYHRTIESITDEYMFLMAKIEKDSIYDLLELYQAPLKKVESEQ